MARMHCRWVRCQSFSANRTMVRAQLPSSALTKLMSGETVAEFMYSSLEKSTVTSAPFNFSDSSRRIGRRNSAGVRESLTPHQDTVPLPFAREALMMRPSCSNCHFCSDIGVPRCGHGDHVVAVVERELEAPFESDPVDAELAAVVLVRQQLFEARLIQRLLVRGARELVDPALELSDAGHVGRAVDHANDELAAARLEREADGRRRGHVLPVLDGVLHQLGGGH